MNLLNCILFIVSVTFTFEKVLARSIKRETEEKENNDKEEQEHKISKRSTADQLLSDLMSREVHALKRKNYLSQLLNNMDTSGSKIDYKDTMPSSSTTQKQRVFSSKNNNKNNKDKTSRRQRNKNKNNRRKHRKNRNKDKNVARKTRPKRDVLKMISTYLEENDSENIIEAFEGVLKDLPPKQFREAMEIVQKAAKKCECKKCKFQRLADAWNQFSSHFVCMTSSLMTSSHYIMIVVTVAMGDQTLHVFTT